MSSCDGDWHYVSASELARLYRVPRSECLVLPNPDQDCFWRREHDNLLARCEDGGDLIALRPRYDGDYPATKDSGDEA